jgi:hypothetical protein
MKDEIRELLACLLATAGSERSPLLRSTTIWTISKMQKLVLEMRESQAGIVLQYCKFLIQGMEHEHGAVRRASCSALATLA